MPMPARIGIIGREREAGGVAVTRGGLASGRARSSERAHLRSQQGEPALDAAVQVSSAVGCVPLGNVPCTRGVSAASGQHPAGSVSTHKKQHREMGRSPSSSVQWEGIGGVAATRLGRERQSGACTTRARPPMGSLHPSAGTQQVTASRGGIGPSLCRPLLQLWGQEAAWTDKMLQPGAQNPL